MNEMIGYIFGSLDIHDRAISSICNAFKAQKRLNRTTAINMVLISLTVSKLVVKVHEQNKKIDSLTKELEELKETKGE